MKTFWLRREPLPTGAKRVFECPQSITVVASKPPAPRAEAAGLSPSKKAARSVSVDLPAVKYAVGGSDDQAGVASNARDIG